MILTLKSIIQTAKAIFNKSTNKFLQLFVNIMIEATIFILGLYNPFIDLENSDVTNNIVREWNYAQRHVAGQFEKIVFVPTFDLFQLSVNDYLYSDHFHPNQAGYELISNQISST